MTGIFSILKIEGSLMIMIVENKMEDGWNMKIRKNSLTEKPNQLANC